MMEKVNQLMDEVRLAKQRKKGAVSTLNERTQELAIKLAGIREQVVTFINNDQDTSELMGELREVEQQLENRQKEMELVSGIDGKVNHGVSSLDIINAFGDVTNSYKQNFVSATEEVLKLKEAYENGITQLLNLADDHNRAKGEVATFLRTEFGTVNPEGTGALAFRLTPVPEVFVNSKHRSDMGV